MDDNSLQPRAGVSSAASVPAAAAGQAEKTLGEAGEAVQQAARQAWSQAGDVADNMLSAGRDAAQAASPSRRRTAAPGGDRGLRTRLYRGLTGARAPVIWET